MVDTVRNTSRMFTKQAVARSKNDQDTLLPSNYLPPPSLPTPPLLKSLPFFTFALPLCFVP